MSSVDASLRRRQSPASTGYSYTPLQAIHIVGQFMRIWSIYAAYEHLTLTGTSVIVFLFICLSSSSLLFLILQQPWKGRPLSQSQIVPSVINGGILALYFVIWGKGLESSGPVRTVLSEYAGAGLGVFSGFLYGRRGQMWRKVGGLIGMMASFYFLSQGWSKASHFPLSLKGDLKNNTFVEDKIGFGAMMISIAAGILSALRRVVARRVSLKSQSKRRLHAITVASATCFLFPFAIWHLALGSNSNDNAPSFHLSWPYLSTVFFGIVFSYYIDTIVEERLHLVVSSPRHLVVTVGCIIVLEQFYKMDFSLGGFLVCSAILGVGMFEATSLERVRKDLVRAQDITSDDLTDSNAKAYLPS